MASNEDKLNRLYREGLKDFAKDPPAQVWASIKQGLMIRNLITFKFMTSLNIYSVTVFVVIAALAGFIAGKQLQRKDNSVTASKNISTIVNDIPKTAQDFEKTVATQNINQHSVNNGVNSISAKPKIESAKVDNQHLSKSINENQTQNSTAIATKVVQNSQKIAENTKPELQTVYNSSPQKSNNAKQEESNSEILFSKNSKQGFANLDTSITSNPTQANVIYPEISNKLSLAKNLSSDKQDSASQQPKNQTTATNLLLPTKKPKTGQGFYAEIFAAPSLLTYKYEQSTKNPNQLFVNSSKEDEKTALSYTTGLELGYGLKNLFAQTGLNYSAYRSKTLIDIITNNSFWQTNLKKDSILVMDSFGNHYQYIIDSTRVLTSKDTHSYHGANNSLHYIEIPILIGYRYYGKRISYAISGGMSVGYLSLSAGETLNPDLKSISVNNSDAIPYKPWTFYLLFRSEASYLLNKHLSAFIRPGFKYNLNSVFEDYYPVQKKFYTIDLHFGIRYNI